MKRPHKYGARPTEIVHKGNVIKCASKAEAKRFGELILLERARLIEDLEFHPSFYLNVNGHPICKYVADAQFTEMSSGKHVVLEVKGYPTEAWKIKEKLYRALFSSELRVEHARG